MQTAPKALFDYDKYWASCFEPAPFLPMSREEMDQLGWDACDFILVCGDAYIDHPSFVSGVIGRVLEAQGFRVGIIAQPDWTNVESFRVLGKPTIAWGVTAGNMDSMINRYTADRKIVQMMLIRQIMNRINVQIVLPRCIVSVAVRLFLMCQYCSVGLKVAYVVLLIMIIGLTKFAVQF
jgi:hypothetical protein